MLTIRLTRVGKKGQPTYRFIVSEKARDPWGRALEILGTYNPRVKPAEITLEKERIEYWISKGAQTSDTVRNLFIDQGILKGDKVKLAGLSIRRKAKLEKEKQAAAK
ncbi:30S ribosomal protein S16 [Candidatus Uhrbacteria bacterium]|nr:30S ribosomal protein S16 [Candidatus Uhrbacteria bacterium]